MRRALKPLQTAAGMVQEGEVSKGSLEHRTLLAQVSGTLIALDCWVRRQLGPNLEKLPPALERLPL